VQECIRESEGMLHRFTLEISHKSRARPSFCVPKRFIGACRASPSVNSAYNHGQVTRDEPKRIYPSIIASSLLLECHRSCGDRSSAPTIALESLIQASSCRKCSRPCRFCNVNPTITHCVIFQRDRSMGPILRYVFPFPGKVQTRTEMEYFA